MKYDISKPEVALRLPSRMEAERRPVQWHDDPPLIEQEIREELLRDRYENGQ